MNPKILWDCFQAALTLHSLIEHVAKPIVKGVETAWEQHQEQQAHKTQHANSCDPQGQPKS